MIYIATFPKNVQSILEELRQAIKESAPEAEEAFSYKMPTFKLNGNMVFFQHEKVILDFMEPLPQ